MAKLGFITDFLSKPILVGYIFGATLIVIGSQLGKMFGIKLESDQFFRQVAELINRLGETHLLTFAIGIVCMVALFIMRRISKKLPGPLVVVVITIILSVVLGWQAKGVAVVGCGTGWITPFGDSSCYRARYPFPSSCCDCTYDFDLCG